MASNHTLADTVSCSMTAPGQGVMRFVQFFLMPGFFLGVLILGVPLNVFSLWVFSRRLSRSNRTILFLHNLAMADTFWLLALPFLIQYHLVGMQWSLGLPFCKVIRLLYHNYFYLSIFFVTCLSVDRYLAIVHPLRSPVLLTRRRAVILCISVWLLALALSIPVGQLTYTSHCEHNNRTVCIIYVFMDEFNASLLYSLSCSCLGFFFPFIALSYCYIHSVCHLRRRADPRLRGLAWELGVAMVIFGLFYLPYHLSRNAAIIMTALVPQDSSAKEAAYLAFSLEMCVCSLSSCTNPLFSCFAGRPVRRELRSTLMRLWKKRRVEPQTKQKKEERNTSEVSTVTASKAETGAKIKPWSSTVTVKLVHSRGLVSTLTAEAQSR
ncbi:P2Y purinoceptor 1-like [Astyanax mexicanus]|uniref:G-protein coupled receptors family 1 profile domain-containing protein n=1 Tax=Astyanax mexicanus TaxID=7994 RepID=A0A3B1K5W7_ASTMX|nr:P2Y purinoceptor 1-like [Astyanax mexicanus]